MLSLSDSTFAVAMTLLIFDVRFDGERHGIARDLWFREWPHYFGYVVSFAVVAMLWMNHHAIFRMVRMVDSRLMVLNLIFLGVVVFIPFPTQVVAAYLLAQDKEQVYTSMFYGLALALATLALAWVWHYAARRGHLLEAWVPPQRVSVLTRRLYLAPLLFAVGTVVGFADVRAALAIYLLIACGYLMHTGSRVALRHPEQPRTVEPVEPG